MIKPIVIALLLFASSDKEPMYGHGNALSVQSMIFVKSCGKDHEGLRIYGDRKGTIPMANPFITDADGTYYYFGRFRYRQETISVDGQEIGTIDYCPYKEEDNDKTMASARGPDSIMAYAQASPAA